MTSRPLPIWKLAGMDQAEYRDLPWARKRQIIIEYEGMAAYEYHANVEYKCPRCGFVVDVGDILGMRRFCPKDETPIGRFVFHRIRPGEKVMDCRFVPDSLARVPFKEGAKLKFGTLTN